MLADPTDEPSRANYAIALYQADRFAEAAPMFERLIEQLGPGAIDAVPLFFSLGYCRLQLGDPRGSLAATTTFLDRGNEFTPLPRRPGEHRGGVGPARREAGIQAALPRRRLAARRAGEPAWRPLPQRRLWPRRKVIETSFRILGIKAKARRARRCKWAFD